MWVSTPCVLMPLQACRCVRLVQLLLVCAESVGLALPWNRKQTSGQLLKNRK